MDGAAVLLRWILIFSVAILNSLQTLGSQPHYNTLHHLLTKRELASIFGVDSHHQVPYYEVAFIEPIHTREQQQQQQRTHLNNNEQQRRYRRSSPVEKTLAPQRGATPSFSPDHLITSLSSSPIKNLLDDRFFHHSHHDRPQAAPLLHGNEVVNFASLLPNPNNNNKQKSSAIVLKPTLSTTLHNVVDSSGSAASSANATTTTTTTTSNVKYNAKKLHTAKKLLKPPAHNMPLPPPPPPPSSVPPAAAAEKKDQLQLAVHTPNRTLTLSLASSSLHDAQLPPHFKLIIREDANHSTQMNLTQLNAIAEQQQQHQNTVRQADAVAASLFNMGDNWYNSANSGSGGSDYHSSSYATGNTSSSYSGKWGNGQDTGNSATSTTTANINRRLCMYKGQAAEQRKSSSTTDAAWIKRLKKHSNNNTSDQQQQQASTLLSDSGNIAEGRVAITGCPGEEGLNRRRNRDQFQPSVAPRVHHTLTASYTGTVPRLIIHPKNYTSYSETFVRKRDPAKSFVCIAHFPPCNITQVGIITTPYEHLVIQPIPDRLYDFIERPTSSSGGGSVAGEPHFLIPLEFKRASLTMPPHSDGFNSVFNDAPDNTGNTNNKHFCGVDKVPVPVELARLQAPPATTIDSFLNDSANPLFRTKRASSSSGFKLYIETAAFLDYKLYTYLLDKTFVNSYDAIVKFVFAIVNTVQHLYNEPSLGYDFDIVLVRLEILKSPNMPFYSEEVDKYLWDFCKWQSTVNPGTDLGDPDHWDHAIILTGFDLRSGTMRSVTGYAPVGGMCNPMYSCTINEGHHFGAAFVIAHEMGHSLGMQHDGQTGMDGNGCDAQKYIMSSSTGRGKTTWSQCSRSYLTGFIGQDRSTCLKDQPVIRDPNLDHDMGMLPGQMYSADKQCQMLYGMAFQKYPLQPAGEVCDMLICANKTVYITGHPALEGTFCGGDLCCIGGTCQVYKTAAATANGASGGAVATATTTEHGIAPPTEITQEHIILEAKKNSPASSPPATVQPPPPPPPPSPPSVPPVDPSLNPHDSASSQVVNGGWSDWPNTAGDGPSVSSVPCTSSCVAPGAGFFIYERQCNNPAPQNGGKPCEGESRRYRTCDDTLQCQQSPASAISVSDWAANKCVDLRNQRRDGDLSGEGAQRAQDSSGGCTVWCRTWLGGYKSWGDHFPDGTECTPTELLIPASSSADMRSFCVEGQCVKFGCDGWPFTGQTCASNSHGPNSNRHQPERHDNRRHHQKPLNNNNNNNRNRGNGRPPVFIPQASPPDSTRYADQNQPGGTNNNASINTIDTNPFSTSSSSTRKNQKQIFGVGSASPPSSGRPSAPAAAQSSPSSPTSSTATTDSSSTVVWKTNGPCLTSCLQDSVGLRKAMAHISCNNNNNNNNRRAVTTRSSNSASTSQRWCRPRSLPGYQICQVGCPEETMSAEQYADRVCSELKAVDRTLTGKGKQFTFAQHDKYQSCRIWCQTHGSYRTFSKLHLPDGSFCGGSKLEHPNHYCIRGVCTKFDCEGNQYSSQFSPRTCSPSTTFSSNNKSPSTPFVPMPPSSSKSASAEAPPASGGADSPASRSSSPNTAANNSAPSSSRTSSKRRQPRSGSGKSTGKDGGELPVKQGYAGRRPSNAGRPLVEHHAESGRIGPDRGKTQWVIETTDCSVQCGGGVMKLKAYCVEIPPVNLTTTGQSHKVDDQFCEPSTRPLNGSAVQRCNEQPCPIWKVIGDWSACNATSCAANDGMQTREVSCVQPTPAPVAAPSTALPVATPAVVTEDEAAKQQPEVVADSVCEKLPATIAGTKPLGSQKCINKNC